MTPPLNSPVCRSRLFVSGLLLALLFSPPLQAGPGLSPEESPPGETSSFNLLKWVEENTDKTETPGPETPFGSGQKDPALAAPGFDLIKWLEKGVKNLSRPQPHLRVKGQKRDEPRPQRTLFPPFKKDKDRAFNLYFWFLTERPVTLLKKYYDD